MFIKYIKSPIDLHTLPVYQLFILNIRRVKPNSFSLGKEDRIENCHLLFVLDCFNSHDVAAFVVRSQLTWSN